MSYTVRHIIETDIDNFWTLTFDQAVARVLMQKLGNQGDFEVLEEREDGPIMHRRIEWRANSELPAFAKKLVGDGTYTEVGTYDRAHKKYTAECVPKLGSEKFLTRYEITAEPLDGGKRCTRVITTENTIKVFGIGPMISKMLEHAQRESHEASAKFLNEWLRERS